MDLVFPNVLIEFHAAMREDPIEFVIPERTYDEPRVSF